MSNCDFNEMVELIRKEDTRFQAKAYDFVREALDHTVKQAKKEAGHRQARHVTGPELLRGVRDYALAQYGPLARTVLNAWGIENCGHIGDIVYNLIEHGVFSKTESDRREDFAEIYDFNEAFLKPFAPKRSRRSRTTSRIWESA